MNWGITICVFLSWIVLADSMDIEVSEGDLEDKVCLGTNTQMVARGDDAFRYDMYRNRYTNCTFVDGNLEIVFLEDDKIDFDLSFLKDIREVTGYVLLMAVYTQYIPLLNLRIIRGRTLYLYKEEHYSLYVTLNAHRGSDSRGLMELRFKSLYEILDGKVFFYNNNLLCYENTILWQDINPSKTPPVEFHHDSEYHRRTCGECDPACFQNTTKRRHCWGSGPDMCQKLNRGDVCNPSCDGRCFGSLPSQCCHVECAGGCTGPHKTDCWACRNFMNEGECVPFCPPVEIYVPELYRYQKNPKAKYAYGPLCVKECPKHLVKDRSGCVKSCGPKKHPVNGTCEMCKGPCPKECKGNGDTGDFLTASMLQNYTDCTVIDGNLKILQTTFDGDQLFNEGPLQPSELEVLSSVVEITGHLVIQSNHPGLKNLSFLRNLETIQGRSLDTVGNAVNILSTPLESLGLDNLKSIKIGKVLIAWNLNLCFADTIDFNKLFSSPRNQDASIANNKDPKECRKEGLICDDQCSDDGCWGSGPEKCLSCRKYRVQNSKLCIGSCKDKEKLFASANNICLKCDDQCDSSCTGPLLSQCDRCLNVQDGPNCVDECPKQKYPDELNSCQLCHPNCLDGCYGNSSYVHAHGCVNCQIGIIRTMKQERVVECLPEDSECGDGYFKSQVPLGDHTLMAGKLLCEPCNEECLTCEGRGAGFCIECKNYRFDQRCVPSCMFLMYAMPNKSCQSCHPECSTGCSGPDSTDCVACNDLKVYINETANEFNCTQVCPEEKPHKVQLKNEQGRVQEKICADGSHPVVLAWKTKSDEEDKRKLGIILGSLAGVVALGLVIGLAIALVVRQKARAKEKTARLTARMTGYDDAEPLTPTEAQPDLAQLRLIKESELRKGSIIGSGAFGTVYKGVWIPDGEQVKIPVAIKVLQEGTSPDQNKELLEEARVMASVDNPCCIRILAVCMTAQMMLITQLMPLGNLLDYVRKNKDHISSKVLLNWCTQIAKGMTYLEERGIVHRDLAARNVLVQAPSHVRITDFGLAKLLDYEEDEYHAAGGKMPIKWLALECIQHRVFTHKSDVWSFGVTVWELFTYGQRPYDNIRARDVPDLLEKGERLSQPSICTIDVYMIMIKCWMLDAESRPSFKELAEEFSKMARDPGRYLVIQGDKLMRLPSHTYDKIDLIRNLSVAIDDPEQVIDAEEYLMPQSSRNAIHTSSSSTKPLLKSDEEDDDAIWEDDRAATNVHMMKEEGPQAARREKRYGHLESAARRRQSPNRGRGDVNSRYSSDPMKMLNYSRDSPDGHISPVLPNGLPPPVPVEMPRVLPYDEDDYLQPKSSNPASYMDLIDSKDYYNQLEKGLLPRREDKFPTIIPPVTVDNPEYFDQSDDAFESEPSQTRVSPPLAHDYYNYGNMPKEKQPLMLNHSSESTV